MRAALLAALLLAAPPLARPAAAQAPAPPRPAASGGWGGSAVHRAEAFRADRAAWHESRLAVQRRGPAGAVGVELGRVERGGRADAVAAADLYRVLSPGVYANARLQVAPGADVVPQADVLGEVYAALGPGWEGSAGVRHLAVPAADVTLAVASLARTAGPLGLRVRAVAAVRPARTLSAALTARYAPEPTGRGPATRVEVTLGQGQEAVVGTDGAVALRRQFVAAVSGQRAVAGPVGLSASLAYTADGALTRWGAETGLAVRF